MYALAIPSRGGDTLFASMYAAYDALPARLKEKLDGRLGAFTYGGRTGSSNALLEDQHEPLPCILFYARGDRTQGLYFDPGKILYVEGLGEAESEDVIEELTNYMVQPGAEYRHKWRKGDIVIWDNRCSYHIAAADYPPERTAYTGAYRYTTIPHHTVRLITRASRPVYACLTPIMDEPCTASTQFKSWGRRCPSCVPGNRWRRKACTDSCPTLAGCTYRY